MIAAVGSPLAAMLRAIATPMSSIVDTLDAVRDALLKVSASYQSDEMMVIDRLMRSSETLLECKRSGYIEQEQALLKALSARWADPDR